MYYNKHGAVRKDSTPLKALSPVGNTSIKSPALLRGVADAQGLYPSELVMFYVVERYKTDDNEFSGYLTKDYEIVNPPKMIKNLNSRGYICVGSPSDALTTLKLSKLKEIATSLGLSSSGKKAEIIERLSKVDEETLGDYIKSRSWKLTEIGRRELDANPYVVFFLGKP